jgi:Flp pilus assembly protein TadG
MARLGIMGRARKAGALARDRSGVTIVEFAILLPFFLTLLFGIIQFAQVLFFQAALQHAVTSAARCSSQFAAAGSLGAANAPPDCSTSDHIIAVAVQQAYGLRIPSTTFTASLNSGGFNCIAARFPYTVGVPFLPRVTLTLTANSCYPVAPASS